MKSKNEQKSKQKLLPAILIYNLSDIYSDIVFGIQSHIYSDILSEKYSDILSGIL